MRNLGGVLTAAILVAAACGGGAAKPTPHPSPAARANLGTVSIGALFPLSGASASEGNDALRGAQLAADILNGKHPEIALPHLTVAQVALDSADTKGDPTAAAGFVDKLAGDHVVALTGAYDSDVTLAVAQHANLLGLPMVTGSDEEPELTAGGLSWFWRVGPSGRTYVNAYFQWLKALSGNYQVTRTVILREEGSAGDRMAADVKSLAPSYGVSVDEDITFAQDATNLDINSIVLRLRGYAPHALFVSADTPNAAQLLNSMAAEGYTPPALLAFGGGFTDPGLAAAVPARAQFAITEAAWSPDVIRGNPIARQVATLFRQQFGQDMTAVSARDFEAVMTIGAAIEAADSVDPMRLQAVMRQLDLRQTITSWPGIRFDKTGQNVEASAVVQQLVGGQYRTVYPLPDASVKLTWPAPPLDKR